MEGEKDMKGCEGVWERVNLGGVSYSNRGVSLGNRDGGILGQDEGVRWSETERRTVGGIDSRRHSRCM